MLTLKQITGKQAYHCRCGAGAIKLVRQLCTKEKYLPITFDQVRHRDLVEEDGLHGDYCMLR